MTATDSSTGTGPYTGSRAYTLTINAPTITVSPGVVPNGTFETVYAGASLSASGGTAPYTFAVTAGALPVGLSLSSGGALTGTPTVSGTFNFTVTATDSSTGTGPYAGTQSYSMTIAPPTIAVSPASLAAGTVGLAYSQTVTASGGTAGYTFAVTSGPLPAGLTLSTGGVLSGTPTAGGSFNITITATDSTPGGSGGPFTSSANYTLTINAPTITVSPGSFRRDVRDGVCGGEPVGKLVVRPPTRSR